MKHNHIKNKMKQQTIHTTCVSLNTAFEVRQARQADALEIYYNGQLIGDIHNTDDRAIIGKNDLDQTYTLTIDQIFIALEMRQPPRTTIRPRRSGGVAGWLHPTKESARGSHQPQQRRDERHHPSRADQDPRDPEGDEEARPLTSTPPHCSKGH